jgi:hypothetical protein
MKKIAVVFFALSLLAACNNKKNAPDVSGVKVDLNLQRLDKDFFSLDTNNTGRDVAALQTKYPELLPLYLQAIVGVSDTTGIKDFYSRYKIVYDTIQKVFSDFTPVKKEIEQGFRYVKHYFPAYQLPSSLITLAGPMESIEDLARMGNGDYIPDFMGPGFMGISLQFYLGRNYSLYNTEYFVSNVAPLYRSRRFSKEYIVADVMKLVAEDLFPDKSKGKPLVTQMIEKGKQWWLLDRFLPETPDSLKTGYTQQQLEWCDENEGLIWSYITKNDELYSVTPSILQTYIGEAPFTSVFSQELSPGNIGQWIGWQIVKKFAKSNPGLKLENIMQTDPARILEDAKYKPK